jgi:TonB family protein
VSVLEGPLLLKIATPADVLPVLAAPVVLPTAAQPAAIAATAEDKSVEPITRVEPVFPLQLRDSLRTGSAQVRFTVEPDGTVSRATSIRATHVRLGMAAVEAVRQWRFKPTQGARETTVELGFKSD